MIERSGGGKDDSYLGKNYIILDISKIRLY